MNNPHSNSEAPGTLSKGLQDLVDEAMQNATQNGYQFADWTAEDIALDLIAFDAAIEGANSSDLLPFVQDWKRRHPNA